MPSPFPGMDPWLEDPSVWPDFHDGLASEIRAALNQSLPDSYYAQLGVREEIGIAGDMVTRRIVPDVSVQRDTDHTRCDAPSRISLAHPRSEVSESLEFNLLDEPQETNYVEIIDAHSGHDVVTLIEILSPANKLPGKDQDTYLKKRSEILSSQTSLIEIDFLRTGRRDLYGREVFQQLRQFNPPLPYIVLVQRAWKRDSSLHYQLFPIRLIDPLPVIAVPLRQTDTEATLDLQYAFQQSYDRGPYLRGAVTYDQPPLPMLPAKEMAWARDSITRWRANRS